MAGDNVAINAGLALIKLIQAILELYMKVMDNKAGKLKNEVDSLKSELEKTKKDHTLSDEEKTKKIDGLEKKIGELEGQIKNVETVRNNVDKLINEPKNVSIVNDINEASQGKNTLTKKEIINIVTNKLLDKAINGLEIDNITKEEFRHKLKKAVKRTMPLEVPDNVHQALSQIDQNHPYNTATINQYITTNINNSNLDPNILQGVQDIKQAFQDGRDVKHNGKSVQTDAQQMTYGKGLGNSMTMTFGGKAAVAQEQEK